jgi:hypothetical protein
VYKVQEPIDYWVATESKVEAAESKTKGKEENKHFLSSLTPLINIKSLPLALCDFSQPQHQN